MAECKIIEMFKDETMFAYPDPFHKTDSGVVVKDYIYYEQIINQYLSEGWRIAGVTFNSNPHSNGHGLFVILER